MEATHSYPILMVDNVRERTAFYMEHFDFKPIFDSNWYVSLQSRATTQVQLAIIDRNHYTLPKNMNATSNGLVINIEVENADVVYRRFCASELPIILPITNEGFGQRRFITQDPGGVLINVMTPIPPHPAYFQNFDPVDLLYMSATALQTRYNINPEASNP